MKGSIEITPTRLTQHGKIKRKRIGALIIAAGMSSRMNAFKPLLPMGRDTVIQCALRRLQEGGVEYTVIVTGNKADLIEKHLEKWPVTFIRNHHYQKTQMFDSILLGLEKLRGKCDMFFLLPVDIPMFRPESLLEMIEALENCNSDCVRPSYKGKHGHPVLFSEKNIEYICSHDGRAGLKGAMDRMNIIDIVLEDMGILYDADTQEEYQELCKYRWTSIPTEGEIQEIYRYFGATHEIKSHCNAVAQTAVEICKKLGAAGWDVDQKQIEAAARLHDAAKRLPCHALKAGDMIEKMGYGKIAEIVRTHMDLPIEALQLLDERAIVYLADKLVIKDRKTTLEDRFLDATKKFDMNEEIMTSIANRLCLAKQVNQKIEEIIRRWENENNFGS